jgi:UDP-3-O-[3-hydroxymyristoyl] glucosamine N-acyltransferase
MTSSFFIPKKKIYISEAFQNILIKNDFLIKNVKTLHLASKCDVTFFDNIKYKSTAQKTNGGACITTEKLAKFLPKKTIVIPVKNVFIELVKILNLLYAKADIDYPDLSLKKANKQKYKSVIFGKNTLIGKNVIIGKNTIIGSNSIIEHNVKIGKSCVIGSNTIIKNSIIGDRVNIQDGNKIGQKGFGFIPINDKNIKFPHIGRVIIEDDVEIASSCTIDRGSVDDTFIGKNTYLDNQVHVAHNVKIGSNCMIAGQVGFAGSSTIGDNVSIGGQAGISGHLKIGKNVKIGGGSGVVKDIEDNQIVMGYPAVPLKDFLKKKTK